MNPPSPWTGSITIAASADGSTCETRASSRRLIDQPTNCSGSVPGGRRNTFGNGMRYTSDANGPNPFLNRLYLLVIDIVRLVRPW